MQSKRLEIARLSLSLFELLLKSIQGTPHNFSSIPLITDPETGCSASLKGGVR